MTTERAGASAPPTRPCGGCGGRAWRPRSAAPAGGWECPTCVRAADEALARDLRAIDRGSFTFRALNPAGEG